MKKIKEIIKKTINNSTKWPKHFLSYPLINFRFNYYSQHGEDGIVEELFRRLKIKEGWLVEFGAWDGIYLSNTFRVIEKNKKFKAVYIEGDKKRYNDLLRTSEKLPGQIIPIKAFVQPTGNSSLDSLLFNTPLPKDFELLSIDVDSIDFQIWENFKNYKPKIVIIEINSSLPHDKLQTHDSEKKNQDSSFLSTLNLGKEKGYSLVHHSGNMIFVRNDLLSQVKIKLEFLQNPNKLYIRKK